MASHPLARGLLIAAGLLCFALALPRPAWADLGDCTGPGYLDSFPEAGTAGDILCIELFRVTVATPAGERTIRGIRDVSADWAFEPGAPAGVERGARLAADAFARLGDYRIDDVTLLLLDDAHTTWWEGERPVLAVTDGRGTPATPGECLVTLYMLGEGGDPETIAINVAHEIFHCLQFATLTAEQMATVGRGGDWWVEGSAEYFAALAVPGSQAATGRGEAFDSSVDAGTPINGMAHETAVLFHWLHGERGPAGLVPFMHGMAGSGDAAAQHAAMRSALSDQDWLRFVQDYADGQIAHPQGGPLAIAPSDGTALSFDRNGTQELPLDPFVIRLGLADYDCGEWRNTARPSDANVALRDYDARDWGSWPGTVDARDDPPARYRIAAIHTDSAEATLTIDAERTVSCQPCGGSDRLDACLVGTWMMSGGGPGEWMRSQGIPLTAFNTAPRVITFRDDGVYGTQGFDTSITVRTEDMVGQGDGHATVAAGRWSAEDGTLWICQDSGGISGTVTVTDRHGTTSFPVAQPGGGQLRQAYSCSDSGLGTTLPFPGLAPMETHYSRLPEPPTE